VTANLGAGGKLVSLYCTKRNPEVAGRRAQKYRPVPRESLSLHTAFQTSSKEKGSLGAGCGLHDSISEERRIAKRPSRARNAISEESRRRGSIHRRHVFVVRHDCQIGLRPPRSWRNEGWHSLGLGMRKSRGKQGRRGGHHFKTTTAGIREAVARPDGVDPLHPCPDCGHARGTASATGPMGAIG
jgi:hypothetical protein